MKILIVSDSHDNVPNIEKALAWAKGKGINTLIHAGDLSAPGVMKNSIAPNFEGTIYIICGSVCDRTLLKEVCASFPKVKYIGDEGSFTVADKKVFLTHYPEIAEKAFSTRGYDLVIHGHTHKSYIKKEGTEILLNPGTLGGLYNIATFAVYDSELCEAEIIELDRL